MVRQTLDGVKEKRGEMAGEIAVEKVMQAGGCQLSEVVKVCVHHVQACHETKQDERGLA